MNIASTPARLLPARDAYDYEDFRARLVDPGLADAGFAVEFLGAPLLAVPVGGVRRGGYASFGRVVDALQARALLGTAPVSLACVSAGRRIATPATRSSGANLLPSGGRGTRSSADSSATPTTP